jgi:hypothetical protein
MEKRVKYLLVLTAAVFAAAAFYFLNPWTAVANTLRTAEVDDMALHRAELGDTVFIYYIPVDNPAWTPVTVEKVEITLLVNGTDYLSRVMQNEPLTVNPGTGVTLQKLVYLAGSPIGYQSQGQRKYMLEATVTIFASAESLGMRSENSRVITDQRSWTYVKLD